MASVRQRTKQENQAVSNNLVSNKIVANKVAAKEPDLDLFASALTQNA